jgi:hypothetical protein
MSQKEIKCTQCGSIDRVPRWWNDGMCHHCLEISMAHKIRICQRCKKEERILIRMGLKRFRGNKKGRFCKNCSYIVRLEVMKERRKRNPTPYIEKPKIKKNCCICGTEFLTHSSKVYVCSPECSGVRRNLTIKCIMHNRYYYQVYTGTPFNEKTPRRREDYLKYKPQKSLK